MSFDTIIDRRGTQCFKYDAQKLIYGRDDLLGLWVADMDFAVSEAIQDAISQRAKHPIFGYNFKNDEFKQALTQWLAKRQSWNTDQHKLISLPSLMTALAISILSLTKPGDGILIQSPVYPPFFSSALNHQRRLLVNSLINSEGAYSIDWQDFESKAAQASMFILCNPHNPIGRAFTHAELSRMAEICRKHNVIIFSDEIHADIVYAPFHHIPIASLAEDITITGISPAKSFNLAGLATAVLISKNKAMLTKVEELSMNLHTFMGNSFGIVAFTAAYGASEAWLDELLSYLQANRDYLIGQFAEHFPKIIVSPIEATFLAWLDIRSYGYSEEELMRILRDDCRLALNPGTTFSEDCEGFVRLNFACPRPILEEAVARLKKAF